MFKVLALLCVMAAVLVHAKPSESVKFAKLVYEHPHRPDSKFDDANASLTRSTGAHCNGANYKYACDGNCFALESKYNSWKATGFNNANQQIVIDYFTSSDCGFSGNYTGSIYGDADQCYGTKDAIPANSFGFSCVVISRSHTS